ncbi:MAG: hypothetical protein RIM96_19780 [Thalassobaculum sp.]|uniref:hypothetical protein n=1 Tax=Thalassobaculum sp. TaxID=2022740 RepID=UPI0032F075E6
MTSDADARFNPQALRRRAGYTVFARTALLQGSRQQANFVVGLKSRHRRKHNFMKLLG